MLTWYVYPHSVQPLTLEMLTVMHMMQLSASHRVIRSFPGSKILPLRLLCHRVRIWFEAHCARARVQTIGVTVARLMQNTLETPKNMFWRVAVWGCANSVPASG